jgi:hypothetical protein
MKKDKLPKLHSQILEVLKNHPDGISINSMHSELGLAVGEQQHLDRRVRDLDAFYIIERKKSGQETLYVYVGEKETPIDTAPVDKTTRARILFRDNSQCKMCGRTVAEDKVKMHIDHRVPREWGGKTEDDNLWALCTECNEGKKNFFQTITDRGVQQALLHGSIHKRIGELLKYHQGQPVHTSIIKIVAYTHNDWEKRLRELRELGWIINYQNKREKGRVQTYYTMKHWEPWPENPAAAIREAEKAKKTNR